MVTRWRNCFLRKGFRERLARSRRVDLFPEQITGVMILPEERSTVEVMCERCAGGDPPTMVALHRWAPPARGSKAPRYCGGRQRMRGPRDGPIQAYLQLRIPGFNLRIGTQFGAQMWTRECGTA